MDIEQMSRSISKLGALMGLDEEKIYNESKVRFTDDAKANANNELEKVKKSFENGTIDDRHRNIIDFFELLAIKMARFLVNKPIGSSLPKLPREFRPRWIPKLDS